MKHSEEGGRASSGQGHTSEFLSFHVLTDHHLLAATQGSCLFTEHFARGRILTHSSGLFIVPNPGVCSVSCPVVKQPSHPKNRKGGGGGEEIYKKKKSQVFLPFHSPGEVGTCTKVNCFHAQIRVKNRASTCLVESLSGSWQVVLTLFENAL